MDPITLGPNQYGKAQCRLVRVARDGAQHELIDLNVSTALAGELAQTHLSGDNRDVLPTDTQKNTVYAFARELGVEHIEAFGLSLARHFVTGSPAIHRARIHIEQYGWKRLGEHSFVTAGDGVRSATVTCTSDQAWVVGGLHGISLLNTTGSQFWGFATDRYTTLAPTQDRILATALDARWRFAGVEVDWAGAYQRARDALFSAFVQGPSLSLQQTLYGMGRAVLEQVSEVVEVRLSLPNKHHFLVDLTPFGLDNPDQVYLAADRPYGLIEGTLIRDGAPAEALAWDLAAPLAEAPWSS